MEPNYFYGGAGNTYELLDSDAQDTFNNLADSEGVSDIVSLLEGLGATREKLKSAVIGWAFMQAGIDY